MPYLIIGLATGLAGFVTAHMTGKPTIVTTGQETAGDDLIKIGFYALLAAAAWQIVKRVKHG